MLRRANKLRTGSGGEPGTANWFADKPKGMWQRTYDRRRLEIDWCEENADRMFIAKHLHRLSSGDIALYLGQ